MLDANYFIVNRNAKKFANMSLDGNKASFSDDLGSEVGCILIDESIYAVLFCDEVRNITFVFENETLDVVTVLCLDGMLYDKLKCSLQDEYHLELSKQNIRINRYAESIAEKLANGVKLRVTDAADNSDMVECPECGMMNTKGSPYCMDCGADL